MSPALKHVPYGIASFETLRGRGFAYVDKTHFIKTLEENDVLFPFIVRPRRFGKSIFANMLMAYYDKDAAKDFEQNFAGTWIGNHPTLLANQYLVLKFDFSGIDGGKNLIANFIEKVKIGMENFAQRYLPEDSKIEALLDAEHSSPAALLVSFLRLVSRRRKEKIFLIIDEYDQFAQEVLSNDPERFRIITGKEGFLKTFYAAIKDATQTMIERTFITGVTSISLDSMTSGFNIAKNLTTSPSFASITGFTDEELRKLIPEIVDINRYGHTIDEIFDRMKVLYDGYRFSPDSKITVFNSSMCLYYLSAIAETNREPAVLLDPSFSLDLSKIDGILSLGKKTFVESVVEDVLFDRPIDSLGISPAINLNASAGLSDRDVLTALVFMGFFTFSSSDPDCLVCPNRAVKDLFFQYWFWRIEHLAEITFPIKGQVKAIQALSNGDIRPLLTFVADTLSKAIGGHAYAHLNETAIQLAVVMAVNTNKIYRVSAEEEALGAGYTDLILKPDRSYPNAAGWLIEFKYLKKADAQQKTVEEKLEEAREQLNRYAAAKNIADIPNLHKAAAVFSGTELKGLEVF